MNRIPSAANPATPAYTPSYAVGDRDERPWGRYIVTRAGVYENGEEYCEKLITVKPKHILSLQSHDLRREKWTVKKGVLTVIVDGRRLQVMPGRSIDIPRGSLHCMANLGDDDCLVEERQTGLCREEDIRRYVDAYNRKTEAPRSAAASGSLRVYNVILKEIGRQHATGQQSARQ